MVYGGLIDGGDFDEDEYNDAAINSIELEVMPEHGDNDGMSALMAAVCEAGRNSHKRKNKEGL